MRNSTRNLARNHRSWHHPEIRAIYRLCKCSRPRSAMCKCPCSEQAMWASRRPTGRKTAVRIILNRQPPLQTRNKFDRSRIRRMDRDHSSDLQIPPRRTSHSTARLYSNSRRLSSVYLPYRRRLQANIEATQHKTQLPGSRRILKGSIPGRRRTS